MAYRNSSHVKESKSWVMDSTLWILQPCSLAVVLGDLVACQACRQNSPRFQASSGNSDSANWPEYEAVDYGF